MAIQNRRGDYNNFDPTKQVAGEFAVVLQNDPNVDDGKAVYITFGAGNVKRLATRQEVEGLVTLAEGYADSAEADAEIAETQAGIAETQATLSESYAVGGTETRQNEDTDNAKYYKEYVENSFDMMIPEFYVDFTTGHLMQTGSVLNFGIDYETGRLMWEV